MFEEDTAISNGYDRNWKGIAKYVTNDSHRKKTVNSLSNMLQIVVPPLPGKAWKRQMPFRGDDGIFEEDFIEERRKGLESFINKYLLFYTVNLYHA